MVGTRSARSAATLGVALWAASLTAQPAYDPYEQIYGPPVDVPLAELAQGTVPYGGRPVRTRGTLDAYNDPRSSLDQARRNRRFVLRDGGFSILLEPRPELSATWDFEAPGLLGRRLEVTGLYTPASLPTMAEPSGALEFWRFAESSEERARRRKRRTREVSLATLARGPSSYVGRDVRVRGEFRGANLFGDLPRASQRSIRDWVIRDEGVAAWVNGHSPSGEGWELDPRSREDAGRWVEVEAEVQTFDGVVYLNATSVTLAVRPAPTLEQPSENTIPEPPPEPPVIVFSLPLDGDSEIPRSSRFAIQFSKDMNGRSFAGRVVLRYSGPVLPGDRPFDKLSLEYDGGRRALHIDPGDVLQPGRGVEILLLEGITDVEGLPLVSRAGRPRSGNTIDRLSYIVAF